MSTIKENSNPLNENETNLINLCYLQMGPSIAELFSMKDTNEPTLPTSYIDLALTLCKTNLI